MAPPTWDHSTNSFAACLNMYLCGPSREAYARTMQLCCQDAYRQNLPAYCAPGTPAP